MSSAWIKKNLKLGTRRSWLATAQSGWVARQIEIFAKRSGLELSVELVGIETRGDVIQDVPLNQIQGKDFFVAELDRALIDGSVDLVVHSLKDLSLERPAAIALAAVPKREDPRDTVFLSRRAFQDLKNHHPVVLGTSSPRRVETVIPYLKSVLPWIGTNPSLLTTTSIRGNVNTRLAKAISGDLGGVVLAQAGVNRLLADPERGAETRQLLDQLLVVHLPLTQCPTNPGQGALAVECRSADSELLSVIQQALDDVTTREDVQRERDVLKKFGGGCHQRFGATSIEHSELGKVLITAGVWGDHPALRRELDWDAPERVVTSEIFDGSSIRPLREALRVNLDRDAILKMRSLLITHSSIFEGLSRDDQKWLAETSNAGQIEVIVPGIPTWKSLVAHGLWVSGSCEGLGQEWAEIHLGLHCFVLTHAGALDGRAGQEIVSSKWPELAQDQAVHLGQAKSIYWTSPGQFAAYRHHARPDVLHACGPGRTALSMKRMGVPPTVFPGREEWKEWLSPPQHS